jgi:hypothetical protein
MAKVRRANTYTITLTSFYPEIEYQKVFWMKMKYLYFFMSMLYLTSWLSCRGDQCAPSYIDIRFDVDMQHAYTHESIIGRKAYIKTKEKLAVCDDLFNDDLLFSNYNGNVKGQYSIADTSCDRSCSPYNYFFTTQPDSLVCVNNYQKLDKRNNKFTLLFKPYVILELHLRSSFDAVEIMNVQLSPEDDALLHTVSIFHNKNFTFGLRRVDTTIYTRVLPEEPVKVTLTGRTTSFHFKRKFTILPGNTSEVQHSIDF